MDTQDFITQGEALYGGHGWKTRLAADLGRSRKTIHAYVNGAPIPRAVELALETLRSNRVREIEGSSNVAAADPTSGGDVAGGAPSPSAPSAAEGL